MKQVQGLARRGHECRLATPRPDLAPAFIDSVPLRRFRKRPTRMAFGWLDLVWRCRKLVHDAVVILHDPELLPAAPLLRLFGARVVFDMHENFVGQLTTKPYLHPVAAKTISRIVKPLYALLLRGVNGNTYAEPELIAGRGNKPHALVQNFPDLTEFEAPPPGLAEQPAIAYIGGVYGGRCLDVLVEAWEKSGRKFRLVIGGPSRPGTLRSRLLEIQDPAFEFIDRRVTRKEFEQILGAAWAGWAVLEATPNYYNSPPTKMFEYLSLRRMVVASDFPTSRKILGSSEGGLLVDPENIESISAAIDRVISNSTRSEEAGLLGFEHVVREYSWETQLDALESLLASL